MIKLTAFFKRHLSFWTYTVFGFLASVINIVAFMVITKIFGAHYMVANTLAWLISVVFGFFTNKSLVFKSRYSTGYALITELIAFFFFRGLSLLVDSGIMMICISFLNLPSLWSKIIDQIIVGVVNYITSRYTFSKEQKEMTERFRKLRRARQRTRREHRENQK